MVPSETRPRTHGSEDAPTRRVETARRHPASPWAAAGVGAAALLAYLWLAPSAPGDKDSGELTLVLAFDGAAHPTGYPLYTLLGHAFTKLCHALGGSFVYAANAWSALGGALAVAFLYALSVRLAPASTAGGTRARLALAALPVALFALNPVWTVETTVAEVYSWHVAWTLGVMLHFAKLASSLNTAVSWSRSRLLRHAAIWGLLCGLGGAHHVSAIYTAAPLSLILADRLRRLGLLQARLFVTVLAAAALPLASYALLLPKAVHSGVMVWGNLAPGWSGLFAHMTGKQYQFLLGRFDPSPVQRELLAAYVYPFLGPGLLVLSFTALRARADADALILRAMACVALVQTLATFGYGAIDPTSYFLAPMALGLCAVVPAAAQTLVHWRRGRLATPGVVAVVAGILFLQVPWVRTGVSRREGYERFDDALHAMWASIPFERGWVLWADVMFARLRVYQRIDGEKPNLDVINPWWLFFPPTRARFAAERGYDPVEGISVPAAWLRNPPPGVPPPERILDDLAHRLNDHTELPVVIFDGEKGSVRLLKKAGTVPSAGDDDLQRRVLPAGE